MSAATPQAAGAATPLWTSLRIQGRVIRALLLREVITRYGRRNVGVLWLVLEPMLFTLGVSALWSLSGFEQRTSVSIAAFAFTGYSSVLMWRNTVGVCTDALHSNINLLYHRNVTVLDVLLARIVLEACGATASFALLTTIWVGLGEAPAPVDMLLLLQGWLMLGWFGAALALLVGAATSYSELVSRLWKPISYILFPLSGAAFMVEWLAPAFREMALLLPMVHGVEMLRAGYFGSAVTTHYDMVYMAEVNLALLFLGLGLLRNAARRLEAK